jgi:hypothetical protein
MTDRRASKHDAAGGTGKQSHSAHAEQEKPAPDRLEQTVAIDCSVSATFSALWQGLGFS